MKIYEINYKGTSKGFQYSQDKATDLVLGALNNKQACLFLTGEEAVKASDFTIEAREIDLGTPEMTLESVKKAEDLFMEYGEVEVEDKKNVLGYSQYDGEAYLADVETVGTHKENHVILHVANLRRDLSVDWTRHEFKVDSFDSWLSKTSDEIFACLYEE